MKIIQRGLTLKSIPATMLEREHLKMLSKSHDITDTQVTAYAVNTIEVFSPIPVTHDGICYTYNDMLASVSGGYKIDIKKESLAGTIIDFTFNKELSPRDYQIPVIDRLSKIEPIDVLGLPLATGRGKTFTICKVLSNLNKRFFLYIKAEYVEKWVKDMVLYFNLTPEEIVVVQGSDALMRTLDREDFSGVKVFIVALQTFKVYIKNYLENNRDYPVSPDKFLSHIQTDIMVVDEGHEAFENIYRAYMVLAPNRAFILTATMYSVDKRIETYMEKLIPEDKRITDGFVNKHAGAMGVQYTLYFYKGFKWDTPFGYSHAAFEKSILRRSSITNAMNLMYKTFLDMYYIKGYKKDDKAVVFFSTKRMCDSFIDYIKDRYPDKRASIYVQGYKFNTVLENDIIATTIGKMGSAIDVPNLTVVLQTVVVSSRTKNEQTIGRLRPIEGRELKYIFFNAMNIPSHKRNFFMRRSILGRVSDSMESVKYNRDIS